MYRISIHRYELNEGSHDFSFSQMYNYKQIYINYVPTNYVLFIYVNLVHWKIVGVLLEFLVTVMESDSLKQLYECTFETSKQKSELKIFIS